MLTRIVLVVALAVVAVQAQSLNKWVYRVSDGLILMGKAGDPSIYNTDQVNYALVTLPDSAPRPDPRTQRVRDATRLRAATSAEIAAYDTIVLDGEVTKALDQDRLISAVAWAIIDTYSAPATKAKYDTARSKIIAAYKGTPWK